MPTPLTDRTPPDANRPLPDAGGLVGIVALAIVVSAVLVWGMARWDARAREPVDVQAAPGTFVQIPLSDGSTVLLGGGSVLRYSRRFGDVRAVALVGEAYVEANRAAAPFVVMTAEAAVTTSAARFDVRSGEGRTRVAVERGALQVAPLERPQSATALAAGDVRDVESGIVAPAPAGVSVADAAAWRVPAGQP